MSILDLEAMGIRVEVVPEMEEGIIAVVGPAGIGILDLRPRPGQYAEAAPFSGEFPDNWPLRCGGLPFDWARDLNVPDFGVRRV